MCICPRPGQNKRLLLGDAGIADQRSEKFAVVISLPKPRRSRAYKHIRVNTLAPNNEPYKWPDQPSPRYINTRAGNPLSLGKALPIAIQTQTVPPFSESYCPGGCHLLVQLWPGQIVDDAITLVRNLWDLSKLCPGLPSNRKSAEQSRANAVFFISRTLALLGPAVCGVGVQFLRAHTH